MKTLGLILVFIILAGSAFFVTQEWQRLFPAQQAIQTGCDLSQQDCDVALPEGGQLHLSVKPRPIPLMQPIDFRLVIQGSKLEPLHLDITGLNMEMGLNRVVFAVNDNVLQEESNVWRGETVLPICTQRHMRWQAQVVLKQGEEIHRLNYLFETQR